jgi:hypothetical protein
MRSTSNLIEREPSSQTRRFLLDLLYAVPDALQGDEGWRRFCHQDLDVHTVAELKRERQRVEWRVAFDGEPSPWLEGRLAAIDEALGHGE